MLTNKQWCIVGVGVTWHQLFSFSTWWTTATRHYCMQNLTFRSLFIFSQFPDTKLAYAIVIWVSPVLGPRKVHRSWRPQHVLKFLFSLSLDFVIFYRRRNSIYEFICLLSIFKNDKKTTNNNLLSQSLDALSEWNVWFVQRYEVGLKEIVFSFAI